MTAVRRLVYCIHSYSEGLNTVALFLVRISADSYPVALRAHAHTCTK